MRVEPEHVLEQDGIATDSGIKNSDMEGAFQAHQRQRDCDYRRTEHLNQGSGVMGPDKQRQPAPGHAGGAHFVNGDDEIESGENGREAGDEYTDRGCDHESIRKSAAEGGVECPAGVDSAHHNGDESEQCASDVNVPTQQIDAREYEV